MLTRTHIASWALPRFGAAAHHRIGRAAAAEFDFQRRRPAPSLRQGVCLGIGQGVRGQTRGQGISPRRRIEREGAWADSDRHK